MGSGSLFEPVPFGPRRPTFLHLLASVLVLVLLTGCGPSRLEVDNEQGRLDQAAPVVEGAATVGQTFVAHHDRLAAVEVLLVVYGETGAPAGELTFHLRSDPASSQDLVTQTFPTGELTHNQTLHISFSPLPDSHGRWYYFFFEGTPDSQVTVWYNTVDAYGEGVALFAGQPQAGDLQFKTFYDYSLDMVAGDVVQGLLRYGWLALPLAALLLLPGYLALLLAVPANELPDPMLQVALAASLSTAILPLVLLFTTRVGLSLTPALFAVFLVVLALATLGRLWQLDWQPLTGWQDRAMWPALGVFGGLLGVTLTLRMLQVRELVVPAWVDGVHHTMMTQLIADQGRVPADYQPYLDIGPFIYHFGFHTLAAGLSWLTGLPVPQAVLVTGQVLNALVGVGVYGLTVTLMGRGGRGAEGWGSDEAREGTSAPPFLRSPARTAGLVAMGVVGTVSLMPAYYATWGRYTQLAGLVVLPTAVMLTLWWLEGGKRWALTLGGVAVAGLGLVHYRVLILYAAFVVAFLIYKLVVGRWSLIANSLARMTALAGFALVLLLPWLLRLWAALVPTGRGAGWLQGEASFNVVPRALIDVGYDRVLLRLALLSLLLGLLWWRRVSILIGLWVGVAVLAANPNLLGRQETWLLSNAVLLITLFLPMGVLTGALVGTAADVILARVDGGWRLVTCSLAWLSIRPGSRVGGNGAPSRAGLLDTGELSLEVRDGASKGGRWVVGCALAGLFFLVMLAGAWHSLDIVNPVTIVATKDDIKAMEWIRENTEPHAGFVTNVRMWQYGTYMGTDGGYWIPLLTGRRTLVPSALYAFGRRDAYFQVQDVLETLAGISQAQDPKLKALMQRHNLEYVYLGAKGGPLDLKSFLAGPTYSVVYSNGPVWIFRLKPPLLGRDMPSVARPASN